MAQFALRCIAGLIESGQSRVEVTCDGYWHFASIFDDGERRMIYLDLRANNYYQTAVVPASTGRSISAACGAG